VRQIGADACRSVNYAWSYLPWRPRTHSHTHILVNGNQAGQSRPVPRQYRISHIHRIASHRIASHREQPSTMAGIDIDLISNRLNVKCQHSAEDAICQGVHYIAIQRHSRLDAIKTRAQKVIRGFSSIWENNPRTLAHTYLP